ncbi:MAG: peptidase and chymotrypsin/Hap [Frankiales bacterium]|nr:peptidase and chymotrypsin/Hap [Frankiales bacterium]
MTLTRTHRRLSTGAALAASLTVALGLVNLPGAGAAEAATVTTGSLAPVRGVNAALEPMTSAVPQARSGGQVVFQLPQQARVSQTTATLVTYESTTPTSVGLSRTYDEANHRVTVTLPDVTAQGAFLQLAAIDTSAGAWDPLDVSPVSGLTLDIAAGGTSPAVTTLGLTAFVDVASAVVAPGRPFTLALPAGNPALDALGPLSMGGAQVGFGPFDGPTVHAELQLEAGQLAPATSSDGQRLTLTVPTTYPTFAYPDDVQAPQLVVMPHAADSAIRSVSFYVQDIELRNPVLPLPNATQSYVTRVYNDLFERNPDAGGLTYWAGRLDSGTPLSSVCNSITTSTENRRRLATQSYVQFLRREPETAGLNGWVYQLDHGLPQQTMEAGFIASQEYFDASGRDNARWVGRVYDDVLGRPASPGEVTWWTQTLARGASRSAVAVSFVYSTEHLSSVVAGYYADLLHRPSEAGGLTYWVTGIQHGLRVEQLIAGIVTSQEYIGRF